MIPLWTPTDCPYGLPNLQGVMAGTDLSFAVGTGMSFAVGTLQKPLCSVTSMDLHPEEVRAVSHHVTWMWNVLWHVKCGFRVLSGQALATVVVGAPYYITTCSACVSWIFLLLRVFDVWLMRMWSGI